VFTCAYARCRQGFPVEHYRTNEIGVAVKRLIASIVLGGSLVAGGIAVPLTLTAESAYAAPGGNAAGHEQAHPTLPAKAVEHVELTPACKIVIFPSGVVICV